MPYTIGVDFGSLSGRAVLVDVRDGREMASAQLDYPHAVMEKCLMDGTTLGADWALQHPKDYLDVLDATLPKLTALVDAEEIIGIGLDCTCSTVLPVYADGTPLCMTEAFANEPHAYIKMWKHHGGQAQAQRMTDLAVQRQEAWLPFYGGRVNAEWYFPKLLETLEEAPAVYEAMAHYTEVVDWLVWQLCGKQSRSAACLGYKNFYTGQFPDSSFFAGLNPAFEDVVASKVSGAIVQLGSCVGTVSEEAQRRWGFAPGTAVAAGNIDAHVCVPAAGIDGVGKLLAIIGTSTCHIVMAERQVPVAGMSGAVLGGVMAGVYGYEAGQSSVGDQFRWFEQNCVGEKIQLEAQREGVSVQALLTKKAALLKPGQSGLVALDWWNGNRSILADADLSGMILGLTLQTAPEEIYRALIESTAYGARVIVDNYREHGVAVDRFYASGGISQKNEMAMQIYADVLQMPVHVADAAQGPALGSAIFAAVAAGAYPCVAQAARAMGAPVGKVYEPNVEAAAVYEKLYREYKLLHDFFGQGGNDVMKRLKAIRTGG